MSLTLKLLSEGSPYYWPNFILRTCSIQIENGFKPIAVAIPRVGWHTFSNRSPVGLKKVARKLESAKVNAVLITKMSLTLKDLPDADIHDFFRYESQPKLLSLSDLWKPIPSIKSVFLIRGTIKPTSEQWTHVWLFLPSCDFWKAWSAMQPSSVTLPCLHRVWFAFINV